MSKTIVCFLLLCSSSAVAAVNLNGAWASDCRALGVSVNRVRVFLEFKGITVRRRVQVYDETCENLRSSMTEDGELRIVDREGFQLRVTYTFNGFVGQRIEYGLISMTEAGLWVTDSGLRTGLDQPVLFRYHGAITEKPLGKTGLASRPE